MPEQTLNRIKSIEEEAAGIIQHARRQGAVSLKRLHEEHSRELERRQAEQKNERQAELRRTEEAARREAGRTIQEAKAAAAAIERQVASRTALAKKEISQCL